MCVLLFPSDDSTSYRIIKIGCRGGAVGNRENKVLREYGEIFSRHIVGGYSGRLIHGLLNNLFHNFRNDFRSFFGCGIAFGFFNGFFRCLFCGWCKGFYRFFGYRRRTSAASAEHQNAAKKKNRKDRFAVHISSFGVMQVFRYTYDELQTKKVPIKIILTMLFCFSYICMQLIPIFQQLSLGLRNLKYLCYN